MARPSVSDPRQYDLHEPFHMNRKIEPVGA
jgi:hypothetical protein